ARGVQMDGTYDETTDRDNDSWDAIWDSGAQLTEQGYTVEFEIPYSSLKFRQTKKAQQWNIKFQRFRPRENYFKYANVKKDRNNNCNLCQQAKIIGFANADPGKNILVNPTFTTNYEQYRDLPNQNFSSDGGVYEFGLDLTWSPTADKTFSGTYNPDFSQIEIDGAQLNVNTNFALYYPEKRPFFLDSADFFDSPSQLVYTRNIADPDYGLRATGRQGEQTYGFFGAVDSQTNVLRPGPYRSRLVQIPGDSTDLVGTYRYGFNDSSNLGTLITSRTGENYNSTMASINGKWETEKNTFVGQWMSSSTNDPFGYQTNTFTGNAYVVNYTYRDREKTFRIGQNYYDPGFRADMGFIGQVDYEKTYIGGAYRWYPLNHFFNEIELYSDWDITHQISVERLMERELEALISAKGKLQSYFEFGIGQRVAYWEGINYDETFYTFYGELTPYANWKLSLFYQGGDQIDFRNNALGTIDSFQPGVTGIINNNISLGISYIDETLQVLSDTIYHAQLLDTRLSWQFNLRQRLRLAVQYGSTTFPGQVDREFSDMGTQLVYSYKINPRTVFYAGYSDNYFGADDVDTFQTNRNLFLKFGYAWQP
ncbi:MAG: hypothetical protein KA902_02960, partial [Arenimonas sp.]|nr:hypothetical protein [Arenimonas sp.]